MTAATGHVRDALASDADALEALWLRSAAVWPQDRALLAAHPELTHLPPEAVAEGRVRVAADTAERPRGFSHVLPVIEGERELGGLFVDPDHLGAGLGRLLVHDVVQRARADGARRLYVVSGTGTQGFYARLGFRTLDEVPTRFGPAVQLSLRL